MSVSAGNRSQNCSNFQTRPNYPETELDEALLETLATFCAFSLQGNWWTEGEARTGRGVVQFAKLACEKQAFLQIFGAAPGGIFAVRGKILFVMSHKNKINSQDCLISTQFDSHDGVSGRVCVWISNSFRVSREFDVCRSTIISTIICSLQYLNKQVLYRTRK
jgi:hypothetical protein